MCNTVRFSKQSKAKQGKAKQNKTKHNHPFFPLVKKENPPQISSANSKPSNYPKCITFCANPRIPPWRLTLYCTLLCSHAYMLMIEWRDDKKKSNMARQESQQSAAGTTRRTTTNNSNNNEITRTSIVGFYFTVPVSAWYSYWLVKVIILQSGNTA